MRTTLLRKYNWLARLNMTFVFIICQQHTTLHTTAGLLLKLNRVGPGQSMDGRPDAAGSGVGGPVGGTLSSGLKISQYPRAVIFWMGH